MVHGISIYILRECVSISVQVLWISVGQLTINSNICLSLIVHEFQQPVLKILISFSLLPEEVHHAMMLVHNFVVLVYKVTAGSQTAEPLTLQRSCYHAASLLCQG